MECCQSLVWAFDAPDLPDAKNSSPRQHGPHFVPRVHSPRRMCHGFFPLHRTQLLPHHPTSTRLLPYALTPFAIVHEDRGRLLKSMSGHNTWVHISCLLLLLFYVLCLGCTVRLRYMPLSQTIGESMNDRFKLVLCRHHSWLQSERVHFAVEIIVYSKK